MNELGYSKPLYFLAFDHRASFAKNMLGISGDITSEQTQKVIDFKNTIFEGFEKAVTMGIPKEAAAVLCDEQFGDTVLTNAKAGSYVFAVCTEKSGQKEFDFEFGADFGQHLQKYSPTFAKALVRYNPADETEMNKRQCEKLKALADWCHANNFKFLIEPLVVATEAQLAEVGGDQKRYDLELRPQLMVEMVKQMQDLGVEPDIWKIEGLEKTEEYVAFVNQAKAGGRENVGTVILGRGADDEQVGKWLQAAAKAEGVVGFAIGRSIFHQPLMDYKDAKISKEQAVQRIAENYLKFFKVFSSAK